MTNRPVLHVALAAGCCLVAGCVDHSVSGTGTRYHYALWLPLLIFLAGLVALPLGWLLRERAARFGWGLMILGPVAALAFAPSLLLERTYVDERGFQVRSGIWGMTAVQDVDFDAATACRIGQEETGGRHSRTIEVLTFDLKNGPPARLPLNNDVKIEAAKEIVARAARRGLPMIGFR